MNLCLGCGTHRFDGYTHVDSNADVHPDVLADCVDHVAGLPDNTVDRVIAWHVIEHLTWEQLQRLIAELHRASKPGAVWDISVPHCTSIHAANPQHRTTFSSTFWDFYRPNPTATGERYGSARLKVASTELRIMAHATGLLPRWVTWLMPDYLINGFGRGWQMVCERVWPFRFDELHWDIEVIK